jgi:hypothetical protein
MGDLRDFEANFVLASGAAFGAAGAAIVLVIGEVDFAPVIGAAVTVVEVLGARVDLAGPGFAFRRAVRTSALLGTGPTVIDAAVDVRFTTVRVVLVAVVEPGRARCYSALSTFAFCRAVRTGALVGTGATVIDAAIDVRFATVGVVLVAVVEPGRARCYSALSTFAFCGTVRKSAGRAAIDSAASSRRIAQGDACAVADFLVAGALAVAEVVEVINHRARGNESGE